MNLKDNYLTFKIEKLESPLDLKKNSNSIPNKQMNLNYTNGFQLPTNPADETFLISDLKWFQTRMLFERKYFQFVSEVYKELAVMVDTNLTRIFYTGNKSDIDDAKKLALDILDKILGTEVEATKAHLDKMTENEA